MNSHFKKTTLPYIACLITAIIFSTHYIIAKQILSDGVSVYSLSAWRGVLGGGLLLLIYSKRWDLKLLRDNAVLLLIISIFGFFINQILFMKGLNLSSATEVAIVSNMIPVASCVFAWLFKIEKINIKKSFGIALSFLAICSLVFYQSVEDLSFHLGPFLILLNVLSFAFAFALAKRMLDRDFPFEVLTAVMLFTGGCMMSVYAESELIEVIDYASLSLWNASAFLFEVVVSTAFVYMLNIWTLKILGMTRVTIFIYTQPILAAAAMFVWQGQLPELSEFLAFGGILLGGFLVLKHS